MNLGLLLQWRYLKLKVEKIRNEIQQVAVKEQLKETFKSTLHLILDFVKQTFFRFLPQTNLKISPSFISRFT